jgi:hypothetical protein
MSSSSTHNLYSQFLWFLPIANTFEIINASNLTSIKLIWLAYYGNTRSHSNIWCLLLWDTFLNINIDFKIILKLFKIKIEQITRGRKKSFKIYFNKLELNIWVWIRDAVNSFWIKWTDQIYVANCCRLSHNLWLKKNA